jgi:hypothetical protein
MERCWNPDCHENVHPRQFAHSCRGTFICGHCGNTNHPDNALCFANGAGCRGRWEDRVQNPDLGPDSDAALRAQYAADRREARLAAIGKGGGEKGQGKGFSGKGGKGFGGKGGKGFGGKGAAGDARS